MAVLDVIRDENLLDNVRAMGALLEQGLHDRLGNHAKVGDIRGRGLFCRSMMKSQLASPAFSPV